MSEGALARARADEQAEPLARASADEQAEPLARARAARFPAVPAAQEEACLALGALGLRPQEARRSIRKAIEAEPRLAAASTEELLRAALRASGPGG